MIGTVKVRIIDAEITVTCDDNTVFTGSYRLVTSLTDARRCPAVAVPRPTTNAGYTRARITRSATRSRLDGTSARATLLA
ncbi:hypothetical protein [Streptomyces sp. NPDC101776]|uniref:hypothetical protein n=1 Tax=Streptomyces sp. NPDC101776 TaxID=3366146 RepID=UPI0037FC40DB